tara:strand:+ start:461 stop:592 length:132 start_codon:yes stop_codon:yes gene_type:complete
MTGERYNEEFKIAAVKQVTEERDMLKEAAMNIPYVLSGIRNSS